MDGLKEILSFLGAVFGLISALIPLLGYLADKRRRASDVAKASSDVPPPVAEHTPGSASDCAADGLDPHASGKPRGV